MPVVSGVAETLRSLLQTGIQTPTPLKHPSTKNSLIPRTYTYIYTYIHIDRHRDGRTDGRTDRQIDSTYVYMYMYVYIYIYTQTHTLERKEVLSNLLLSQLRHSCGSPQVCLSRRDIDIQGRGCGLSRLERCRRGLSRLRVSTLTLAPGRQGSTQC